MAKLRIDLVLALSCVVGCSGGLTQRTLSEAGADDGAAGGASLAEGGQAGASMILGAGSANAGEGGVPAMGGSPNVDLPACVAAANPLPLRALSTWEYGRSVLALTGTAVTEQFPRDPRAEAWFAFSMAMGTVTMDALFAEAEKQGVGARGQGLLPCDSSAGVDDACAEAFVDKLLSRAFRRPLAAGELERYVGLFKAGSASGDFESGVELVVTATLLSPLFLYKTYGGGGQAGPGGSTRLTGFEVASRLSYLLSGAPPDAELSSAAANGDLDTDEGMESATRRLMAEPAFNDAVLHFHTQWLGLDDGAAVPRPGLPPELLASMRSSTERFIVDIFQDKRRWPDLLLSDTGFVDQLLAPRYGVAVPAQGFAKVELDPVRYFGVLSQPSLLTRFDNPTSRGLFVRQRLLCTEVPAPPPNIDTSIEIQPGQTRREAWMQHQTDPSCAGCHQLIDAIGFGFENFDELGIHRTTDNGQPVDSTGQFVDAGEIDGPFVGVGELAALLSESKVVGQCLAKTWLTYASQRRLTAGDDCAVQRIHAAFANADLDIGELLVELALSTPFRSRDSYEAPSVSPPQTPATGPVQSVAQRRMLLLDFNLAELNWLSQPAPADDRRTLDQHVTLVRDLQRKLSQL